MNLWDILLLLLIACALFFAVRGALRGRAKGGGCGCAGCAMQCKNRKTE